MVVTRHPTPASTRQVSTASILQPRDLLTTLHLHQLREVSSLQQDPEDLTTVSTASQDTTAATQHSPALSTTLLLLEPLQPRLRLLIRLTTNLRLLRPQLRTPTTPRSEMEKLYVMCK